MLVADPDRSAGAAMQLDALWAAGLEANPVQSFQDVQRPTTLLDVQVVHLPDASAAVGAAAKGRSARCPSDKFRLNIGLVTARRGHVRWRSNRRARG
ncbi:hypothetical protein NKG94_35490 [Micromonospora sp. M12]